MLRLIVALLILAPSLAVGQTITGGTATGAGFGAASSGGSVGACTDGVDCYCDTVSDPNLLTCEDFEDDGLYDPAASDNWAAGTSSPPNWNRGNAAYWVNNYGNGTDGFLWKDGYPVSPQIGSACDLTGAFTLCAGNTEWCSTDQGNFGASSYGQHCFDEDANNGGAIRIDVIGSADDLTDDVSGLTLTGGNSASGVVFDGNRSFSYRNAASETNGIAGTEDWGSVKSHVGVTYAMAYSSNTVPYGTARSPMQQAWKHEEWYEVDDPLYWEMSLSAGQQDGINDTLGEALPFANFHFNANPGGGGSAAACASALAGATVRKGNLSCDAVGNLVVYAEATEYEQSTDFPFGTWGCFRHEMIWSGGYLSRKSWFNDTLVIDFDTYATTALHNDSGYKGFKWNNYMNVNDSGLEPDPNKRTNITMYRYLDNFHVTNGTPVSCASIGFP